MPTREDSADEGGGRKMPAGAEAIEANVVGQDAV